MKSFRYVPLTNKTACANCGHRRDAHCMGSPRMHYTADDAHYYCVREHCEAQNKIPGRNALRPCRCDGFRAHAGAPVKMKRPEADDFTPCLRCRHPKNHHCRVQRTESGETGFFVGSVPYQCSHFDAAANPTTYHCRSGHCAEWDEAAGVWCECPKFVNPWVAQQQPRNNTAQGTLFPGTLFPVSKVPRQSPRTKTPAPQVPDAQLFMFHPPAEEHTSD